jgi:hypothetical protein
MLPKHQIKKSQDNEIFPKKSIFSTSVKEPKIHMGANQRNLQAPSKILQKLLEHQIN